MNVKARRATRRTSRLVRWLARRNALRRPVDRIEGAVLVVLSAALLVAVAVAAVLGTHAYRSQRAASASLHPTVAVLIQAGPFYGSMARIGQAEARWRDRARASNRRLSDLARAFIDGTESLTSPGPGRTRPPRPAARP